MSPAIFGDQETFFDEIESMVSQIKASELLPGIEEVFLPGEPEQRRYRERIERGTIAYPRSVVEALAELSARLSIPFAPDGSSADA